MSELIENRGCSVEPTLHYINEEKQPTFSADYDKLKLNGDNLSYTTQYSKSLIPRDM
jgi:hypothetical protein